MSEDKKDKPKRMMARKDFKVLRDRNAELREKQQEMNQALTDLCDKHADENWWPDKMRVDFGWVLVTVSRDGKMVEERKRIPVEERKEIQALGDEITALQVKIADKVFAVALAAAVPVDQVNVQTGEIMAARVEECQPAANTDVEGERHELSGSD